MASILIAEDEDVLRRNLTFILSSAGYATLAARSSTEAIDLLGRRSFDVVITDLLMPGQGGGEVIRYVAENCPETAVIVITAYPSADTAIDAVKKGVVDYFTKPFRTEDILKSVGRALEQRKELPLRWERLSSFGITRREEDLLRLMIEEGAAENSDLAVRLEIKPATVKQHLDNLFGKFSVGSKASLIAAVIKALRR